MGTPRMWSAKRRGPRERNPPPAGADSLVGGYARYPPPPLSPAADPLALSHPSYYRDNIPRTMNASVEYLLLLTSCSNFHAN